MYEQWQTKQDSRMIKIQTVPIKPFIIWTQIGVSMPPSGVFFHILFPDEQTSYYKVNGKQYAVKPKDYVGKFDSKSQNRFLGIKLSNKCELWIGDCG